MSHKVPQTSRDAHNSVQEMKPDHHAKILEALKELGEASAEQIATHLSMQHSQINRRVSELLEKNLIYRPGNKVATLTGRSAYTWRLVDPESENKSVLEKAPEGEGVGDFSRKISELSKMPYFLQSQMFGNKQ